MLHIMSKANYFTCLRMLIAPLFLLVYTQHEFLGLTSLLLPCLLLVLMTISEVSDLIDGYIARKYNEVTDLGKILDPMADSIFHVTVFLSFTKGPVQLPLFLPFIVFYRDALISALRTACALRGFTLAARPSGKFKTASQAIAAYATVLAMIPHALGWLSTATLQWIAWTLVSVCCIYTVYTGLEYLTAHWSHVNRLLYPSFSDAKEAGKES